jgi:hypothetical protein
VNEEKIFLNFYSFDKYRKNGATGQAINALKSFPGNDWCQSVYRE